MCICTYNGCKIEGCCYLYYNSKRSNRIEAKTCCFSCIIFAFSWPNPKNIFGILPIVLFPFYLFFA